MRHRASLLVDLEGMSRPAFRIAQELASNSRSGLTIRFLAKKLEIPEEEVEYLIDVNPKLMFFDLTKVKLAPEGISAVKRIAAGLENYGDIPSLFRGVKALSPHEFRSLEELVGLDEPVTKKIATEALIDGYYKHPDSLLNYVATRGFSEHAREVFDILWQSKNGVMNVSKLHAAYHGSEFEVEQSLWELFRGFACFEMFRFSSEDRLVRSAGILSEIRQYRETADKQHHRVTKLKPVSGKADTVSSRGLDFSDTVCQLVAAIAARPVRLRSDGELFREDRRRLSEICGEDDDPSLNTCLWVAEGVQWLVRVDDTLRAGKLEALIQVHRIERHRILYEWLMEQGEEHTSRGLFTALLDVMRLNCWYSSLDFIEYALSQSMDHEQPVLKAAGAHWQYVSPSVSGQSDSRLARSLEESFFWLGLVDRGYIDGESVFQVTSLGAALLCEDIPQSLQKDFPPRQGEIIVQPNFDIVVPTQEMDPLLTVPLDQFAQRASTGQATVYQVSRESFTHAVQEGHDANAFVDFLLAHNRSEGGLPKNVTTTLEDWRGAMKRVRLRTIHVLETDDTLVMADLMHRRKMSKYFNEINPKKIVAYKDISKATLTKTLEKEGFIVD